MLKVVSYFSCKWLKGIFLLPVFIGLEACSHVTLEDQFEGINNCDIDNVFLDPVTNKASGRYFVERQLEPCRIDEAAFYCVNDTFYGLSVSEVAIPYHGPFSVHAIYFRESPMAVEAALRKRFGDIELNQNDGASPILIVNPKEQGSSVLYCDKYSE